MLAVLTYHIDMYYQMCAYQGHDEEVCECVIEKLDEDDRELEDIPGKILRRRFWECKGSEI